MHETADTSRGDERKTEIKTKVQDTLDRMRSDEPKPQKYTSRSEEEIGVTQFIDSSEGFTGITKHRWSDFIVHEIDAEGQVCSLSDLSVPTEEKAAPGEATRPEWFPEAEWEKVAGLSSSKEAQHPVHIPAAQMTKEDRTKYHGIIKSCFPKLVSNTSEVAGEKVIAVSRSSMAPDKRNTFWKHKPWPKGRPKFLHFCLYKENTDTFAALSMLSMDLKLKSNKFHIAGTKDARAKTTQRVAIKQVTAEKVHQAASKFHKLAVGNFTYQDRELKLGDLKGNQFDIVLRDVEGGSDVIARRAKSFQEHGFLNYYGMQRFGATSSATHLVGRAIIRKEWRTAVDMLLGGRADENRGSLAKAQEAWQRDRDPKRAYALLSGRQQRTTIEGRVLHTLCSVRATAYQEAIDRLPSNTRQLYVHAYQSWLWNRLVSRRVTAHGLALLPGDLVLVGDGAADAAEAGDADVDAEAPLVEEEVTAESKSPLGKLPEVRALTEAELSQHTITDLVLPLPGWAVRLPDNPMADWYAELLAADSIELSRAYCDTMPQYSLAGAYRRVLARPTDVSWRIAHYDNPAVELIRSDWDQLHGKAPAEERERGAFRALVLQFQLPTSCYATMALRELTGMDSSLATQVRLNEAYLKKMRQLETRTPRGGVAQAGPAEKMGDVSTSQKETGEAPGSRAETGGASSAQAAGDAAASAEGESPGQAGKRALPEPGADDVAKKQKVETA